MRLRTIGIAALLGTAISQTGGAVVAPKGLEAPIVSADRGGRLHRTTAWTRPGTQHALAHKLAADGLAGWTAQWDRDTDVPLRMWGQGIVVSGSVADAAIAENAARQFLAQHLATLAPGSQATDFELVSNQLSGDLRSIGFIQRSQGVRVLGGSISFAFKADRLVMVGSTALPHVAVAVPTQRLAPTAVRSAAINWLAGDGHFVVARSFATSAGGEQVIVPTVRPRRGSKMSIDYKLAEQLEVDAVPGAVGKWTVWVDATTAAPIQRKTGISYASGRVLFFVPDRGPHGARSSQPAPFARFTIDGATVTSTADGTVTWPGTANGAATLTPTGQFVTIVNRSGVPRFSEAVSLAPNTDFSWNKLAEEIPDAQLDAYVYANQVKTFVKTRLNLGGPTLAWVNDQLSVFVNEDDACNAFSTGDDIHFFQAGGNCENTGRLSDVVYHEFGHSLHANAIISGVGDFDGALSEGLSDTLSQAITNDSGMGRGFFRTNAPLRELNPATDKKWGVHTTGEVHDDGEIIGGTLWDLRKSLEASMGEAEGYEQWLKIFYSIMQRASDIPSTYAEALLADDDDGDLSNGTPHQCDIDLMFAAHSLTDPTLTLGITAPVRESYKISLAAAMPPPSATPCPKPTVTAAQMVWRLRGGLNTVIDMTPTDGGFTADIPEQLDGSTIQYQVLLTLSDSNTISFPNNAADPFYEFFVGPVEVIKCFDFEDGNVSDWLTSTDWQVGAPEGLGGDPSDAFGGTSVFGQDLSNDGVYRDRGMSVAESPEIDLGGAPFVRLQYRRWLGVEDGFFDKARIFANDKEVWSNFTSPGEPQAGINHIDREWIFQDIDVTKQTVNGKLKLRFELESDEGLSFGGWTMDDVCVVRASGVGLTCGNSAVDEGETCDDGNRTPGDGCDTACQSEDDGGCCSSSTGSGGALALSVLTLGMVFRRRRRRS